MHPSDRLKGGWLANQFEVIFVLSLQGFLNGLHVICKILMYCSHTSALDMAHRKVTGYPLTYRDQAGFHVPVACAQSAHKTPALWCVGGLVTPST